MPLPSPKVTSDTAVEFSVSRNQKIPSLDKPVGPQKISTSAIVADAIYVKFKMEREKERRGHILHEIKSVARG